MASYHAHKLAFSTIEPDLEKQIESWWLSVRLLCPHPPHRRVYSLTCFTCIFLTWIVCLAQVCACRLRPSWFSTRSWIHNGNDKMSNHLRYSYLIYFAINSETFGCIRANWRAHISVIVKSMWFTFDCTVVCISPAGVWLDSLNGFLLLKDAKGCQLHTESLMVRGELGSSNWDRCVFSGWIRCNELND